MRRALGKGLAALIPVDEPEHAASESGTEPDGRPVLVPLDKIRANRYQPRKNFDSERLSELADSIKEHGLAQPIIVSKDDSNGTYELIAGERRLRACQLAGLAEVEVVVRETKSDKQRLALALVENLQREDLNAIETALGYLRLMKEFQISQTELTKMVGKSKSAISNTLRLLELPENIQKSVQCGQITEGHARAMMMVDDQSQQQELYKRVIDNGLSVRDTEDLARAAIGHDDSNEISRRPAKKDKSADIRQIEDSLQHLLGTKVAIKIKKDPSKGSITIHFYSLTDFDKLVNILKK